MPRLPVWVRRTVSEVPVSALLAPRNLQRFTIKNIYPQTFRKEFKERTNEDAETKQGGEGVTTQG